MHEPITSTCSNSTRKSQKTHLLLELVVERGHNMPRLIQHWSNGVNKHLKASLLNKLQEHICMAAAGVTGLQKYNTEC